MENEVIITLVFCCSNTSQNTINLIKIKENELLLKNYENSQPTMAWPTCWTTGLACIAARLRIGRAFVFFIFSPQKAEGHGPRRS